MKKNLTEGNVTASMFFFALPMILGNVLQQCYNLVDTWIVGKYIGAGALAAVGSAYTLMTFLNSLIIGMCMGAAALFSISYGSGNVNKMKEYIYASFVLILGITVIMMAGAYFFLDEILWILQTPSEIYGWMKSYVKVICTGLIFIFLYNYFSFLLRSLGNSLIPLIFLAISTILNICLDYIFVVSFRRGVAGAAEATVISQCVSAIGIAVFAFWKEPLLRRTGNPVSIRKNRIWEILSYASTTGAQQSVMNFGILMVQGLVNSFGTSVMAAFAAGVKIDSFAYMPAQEFGNAYSIFISQNYGAGKQERIKRGNKSAFFVIGIFCILVSVFIWWFAESLIGIFVSFGEKEIIRIGSSYLRIEGACYVGIGILFLLYGYFRAIERPQISLLLTVISLGSRVLIAYVFSVFFGAMAIWAAIPIGWALADITGVIILKKKERILTVEKTSVS